MEKKQDIVHDITVTCVVVVVILNSYCMSATTGELRTGIRVGRAKFMQCLE